MFVCPLAYAENYTNFTKFFVVHVSRDRWPYTSWVAYQRGQSLLSTITLYLL